MQTKDELNLQRYFDMQEHPEKYTDEELEAMMDELDRVPDVEQAWQEVMGREKGKVKSEKWAIARARQRWVGKVAAIFIGILFLSGIAYAAIHIGRQWTIAHSQQSTVTPQPSTLNSHLSPANSPVYFDNVPLDSVLTVVSAHYRKAVLFRDEAPRHMKLMMTWQPDAPLADFLDRLNAFDGLSLRMENDTIFVMQMSGEEGKR